jgi:hypothetical protein
MILSAMIATKPKPVAGRARATPSGRAHAQSAHAQQAHAWPAAVLAVLLLLLVAARFAEPIQDGDIFWHMVYGAQMLAHGSLRVDHSQFSWMPASNDLVYCAWIGELLFAATWKCFGIAGLFALRYAAVLAMLGLMAVYAHRRSLLARPETWLVLLVAMLASVVATLPKPEMLSLVLWNALVFCWFELLEANERGANLLPWIYASPCIVLLWVNTHGDFALAAPFILITTAAAFFLLPRRVAWHAVAAAVLCALATAVTPYGVRYPLQLLDAATGRTPRPDVAWNNAFQHTLGPAGQFLHLPELLVWMTLAIVAACIFAARNHPRRAWIVVAALFVAYAALYLLYVRSTFLLPAIFAYGVLSLVRATHWPRWSPALACALFLFLAGRSFLQALERPDPGAWMGFGIGYSQPVDEAEFLARGNFGPRIYNTYNAGGYLIWRLFPRYKVMVDARSFPYLAWFDELQQFSRTQNENEFQAFLNRHPGDVALVDFQEDFVWRSFLKSPGWRPAYYGPDAAVFVHADQSTGRVQAADSLQTLRNGGDGVRIFDFAIAVGDYPTAWSLLDQMQGRFHQQVQADDLQRMLQYRSGQDALRAGNYPLAWQSFESSFRHHPFAGQDATILLLLRSLLKVGNDDPRAPLLRAGLARLAARS